MKYSSIGVALALFTLTAAFLSPWIISALSPPAPPIEAEIVDFASKLKDAAIAKSKGQEYVPKSEPSGSNLIDYYQPIVIGLAMVSVCLGVIGMLSEQKKLPGGLAIGFGLTAAVAQWSIFFALAVIGLILIFKVLDVLDVGLSIFN